MIRLEITPIVSSVFCDAWTKACPQKKNHAEVALLSDLKFKLKMLSLTRLFHPSITNSWLKNNKDKHKRDNILYRANELIFQTELTH